MYQVEQNQSFLGLINKNCAWLVDSHQFPMLSVVLLQPSSLSHHLLALYVFLKATL